MKKRLKNTLAIRLSALLTIALMSTTASAQWVQKGQEIEGENDMDQLGQIDLSYDGNTMIVSSSVNDDGGDNAGKVRVFEWDGGTWGQKGSPIYGDAVDDQFGWSVSVNGDGTIIAGGSRSNDDAAHAGGHVRVFEWNGSDWSQLGVDIDGDIEYGIAGRCALSDDGHTVVIGAYGEDSLLTNSGSVRVYHWNGSSWNQMGSQLIGEASGDGFGIAVDINADGTIIAVGADGNDGTAINAGHVRVFEWDGGSWVQIGSDIDGEAFGDNSGRDLSISNNGDTIAIGSYYNDGGGNNAGHVRVYSWNGTFWSQVGADINGEEDALAGKVALNGDGTRLIIGANGYDPGGLARVYFWDGTDWLQEGQDLLGEAPNDNYGNRVAISSDGETILVSAKGHDILATNEGQVKAYFLSGLGINELTGRSNLEIFPNPTSGRFTISLDEGNHSEISVFDATGRLVHNRSTDNATIEMDLTAFEAGVYTIVVLNQNKTTSDKVLLTD